MGDLEAFLDSVETMSLRLSAPQRDHGRIHRYDLSRSSFTSGTVILSSRQWRRAHDRFENDSQSLRRAICINILLYMIII